MNIEKTLQQAIIHHRAGQLQDAERLYRAILKAQPNHPDANHNLGLLAVGASQPATGLPHFKLALEANPMQGQYWLSYIDALIQSGQNDIARQVLAQGLKRGLQGKAVESLTTRLEGNYALLNMIEEINNASPLYKPTNIWQPLTLLHLERLKKHGIANFKLTLNEHYSQWAVVTIEDELRSNISNLNKDNHIVIEAAQLESPQHFGDKNKGDLYTSYVWQQYRYLQSKDTLGLLPLLSESLVGNPIRIRQGNRYISQDIALAYLDFLSIVTGLSKKLLDLPVTIAEIGAGYGCLASIFGTLSKACYWIIDIPPTLYVSQSYIQALFPTDAIFKFRSFSSLGEVEAELSKARFAFFTPNQIEMLADKSIDIFVNVDSFAEMTIPQVENYMAHARRICNQAIYLRNYDERSVSRYEGKSYPMPKKSLYHPGPLWDCIFDQDFALTPRQFQALYRHI